VREQLRPLDLKHRSLMDAMLRGDYARADEVAQVQEKISELLERIARIRAGKE
jgi:hypothetical protein